MGCATLERCDDGGAPEGAGDRAVGHPPGVDARDPGDGGAARRSRRRRGVRESEPGPEAGCTVLAPTRDYERDRLWWRPATGDAPVPEADADAYLERERRIDPDLWVLEIEDRDGWNPFAETAP